jgi:hypothetical protein
MMGGSAGYSAVHLESGATHLVFCVVSAVTDAVPSVLSSVFYLLCLHEHICGLFGFRGSWTTNPRHGVSHWDATDDPNWTGLCVLGVRP